MSRKITTRASIGYFAIFLARKTKTITTASAFNWLDHYANSPSNQGIPLYRTRHFFPSTDWDQHQYSNSLRQPTEARQVELVCVAVLKMKKVCWRNGQPSQY